MPGRFNRDFAGSQIHPIPNVASFSAILIATRVGVLACCRTDVIALEANAALWWTVATRMNAVQVFMLNTKAGGTIDTTFNRRVFSLPSNPTKANLRIEDCLSRTEKGKGKIDRHVMPRRHRDDDSLKSRS